MHTKKIKKKFMWNQKNKFVLSSAINKRVSNKDEELLMLSKNRDALLQRNIELRLEQQAVTEQLRQIEAEIRRKKLGVQYGKK